MSMTIPASVSSDGTRRTVWIEGGAADPANVSTGELAGGLDLSFYLTHGADGFNSQRSQAAISDNRQGSSQDFQKPGRKSPTLSIRYTFNDDVPADNEAKLELTAGKSGAFVHLFQVPEDYDAATDGDYAGFTYEYWPVQLGEQAPMPEEANMIDRINQSVFVNGPVVEGVVVSGS